MGRYEISIKRQNAGESSFDWAETKREAVQSIAFDTGLTQREVAREMDARVDSVIMRDSLGFRVYIYYVDYANLPS